jgi:iron complex outermembrane recepter protein
MLVKLHRFERNAAVTRAVRLALACSATITSYALAEPAPEVSSGPEQVATAPQSVNATPQQPAQLQEVIVTANRRQQAVEAVPYSLTVVSADQISGTGTVDIATLTSQVPGLSMFPATGTRDSAATFPIIRGINASQSVADFRTFEQSPVGVYVGNSPVAGYIQFDDVQRIEVLRGPQGTLYGAGALGGAIRIIPNSPELGQLGGSIEAGVGAVAHASEPSYSASGMLNVPMGDAFAFRIAGKYEYEPGFIDAYGLMARNGSSLSSLPILADPSAPVTSSGIFYGKKDWNDQDTFTGRASLLWKPVDEFNAELGFLYVDAQGDAAPVTTPYFTGGPYPVDPRITFPPNGDYGMFSPIDQPWSRRTALSSLDLSYDAGFATVSATTSYSTTNGSALIDGTGFGAGSPVYAPYYGGTPINPRFIYDTFLSDDTHTFSQELRLVSKTSKDSPVDYVVGVFYQNQTRTGDWKNAVPGTPEYGTAQGCTGYGPGSFPDCLVRVGPDDVTYHLNDSQNFKDTSEYGELTWHWSPRGQITFGGRHFQQEFTDTQTQYAYTFQVIVPETVTRSPASKNTWKINPSYEYMTDQYVYALWSEGFRRGGANSVPTSGPFAENPALLTYVPDSTDNYELGLKGRTSNGISYTIAAFDVEWHRPQIAGYTPIGFLAVWNGEKARSTGVEFDLTTPLGVQGLYLTAGGSYLEAKLTEDFSIPADAVGDIVGKAGEPLPGSAKASAAATIDYTRALSPDYLWRISLNDTYRSSMYITTFAVPVIGLGEGTTIAGMNIVNFSTSVTHKSWRLGLYGTNVFDKRVPLSPAPQSLFSNGLGNPITINPPREIDLRLAYTFGSH